MYLSDIVRIFYIDWFIALLIFLMGLGCTYLISSSSFYTNAGLNRGILKFYFVVTIIYIAIFYVAVPTPLSVQSALSAQIISVHKNNENPNFIFTKKRLNEICGYQYVSALDFFSIQDSYNKDLELLMKKNSFIQFRSISEDEKNIEIPLCSLQGNI